MIDKVLNYVKKYNMIQSGDKILVALSGGPDSVCLLHILYSLRKTLNIELYAAHVNHCLRGKDADDDEQYVRDLCNELGVKVFTQKFNVEKYGEEKGLSCEMAGREVRYKYFNELRKKYNIQKIALAHNANDQAETLLMRIMRGTGVEGLCGIRPVRDKIYIRPILGRTRKEIESYCENIGLKPRIDKTNLECIYSRNKVRLEIIPYMEQNFNKDVVAALNRLGEIMQGENELLKEISKECYEKYCYKEQNRVIIRKEAFHNENENLLARIIRNALYKLKGNMYNFEKNHVRGVIEIGRNSTGTRTMLPNDVVAYNNYGDVYIYSKEDFENSLGNNSKAKQEEIFLSDDSVVCISNIKISLEIIPKEEVNLTESSTYTKFFDYDNINGDKKIRYRQEGDTFNPLGMKGNKSLKKMFVDMKVPREKRNEVPLVCFGEDIAWIVGYRVSEKYKVTDKTKQVLKIKIERGKS